MTTPELHPNTCPHTVTRGRPPQSGSWCVDCGIKVFEVHDRPCVECTHFRQVGVCVKHHMRVSADMYVTYYLVEVPGRHGLCFEANSDE